MDPGKHVGAEVRYELAFHKTVDGKLPFLGSELIISTCDEFVVIRRVTLMRGSIMDVTIVGVIGTQYRQDASEFLRLSKFLSSGGVIGIHRDLRIE